jgi:hypothetical protein
MGNFIARFGCNSYAYGCTCWSSIVISDGGGTQGCMVQLYRDVVAISVRILASPGVHGTMQHEVSLLKQQISIMDAGQSDPVNSQISRFE